MDKLQLRIRELEEALANEKKQREELSQANQRLEAENEELKFKVRLMEDILDNMYEGVHAIDRDGKVIIYSRANEKYDVWKKEEVIGRHESEFWDPPTGFALTKEQIIEKGKPIKNVQIIGNSKAGKQFNIIAGFYPYFEDGECKAFYYTGRDITTLDSFIMQTYELQKNMRKKNYEKKLMNGCKYTLNDVIGNSTAINDCKEKARRFAKYSTNILIYGETGSGKELFAQGIHNESLYAFEPFIALNCSAVPETLIESLLFGTVKGAFTGAENMQGLFEQVGKGTLFLDEINSMPLAMQAKLLRVLQEKRVRRIGGNKDIEVECCVICATNMDPMEAVKKNILREDFYYRISTIQLTIPPLRDRKVDIPILVDYFIKELNRRYGKYIKKVSPDVMASLIYYNWPGNVRELLNTLEYAVILCDENQVVLTGEYFPNYIYKKSNKYLQNREISASREGAEDYGYEQNLNTLLDNYEKSIISKVLGQCNHNISAAAKRLGIDRKSLYRKIEKYNLKS